MENQPNCQRNANDLAIEYQADNTCPVTIGIFLRIVSEASYEELKSGKGIEEVTPFGES